MIQSTAFDTIYHEHVHYYGFKPLAKFLEKNGFSIIRFDRIKYMCGSIRVFCKTGGQHHDLVKKAIVAEEKFGLYDLITYQNFMDRVKRLKFSINEDLWKIKSNGGEIVGIGAATKGNTLLNYCKLDSDVILYSVKNVLK